MQYLLLCMHSFQFFEVTFKIKSHINVTCVTTILFTRELLRFIMLVLHVHLQMFFRKSFKAAYDTSKHGECRFVLLAMMLCLPNVIIFPYKKENILGKKLYVLNSGTTTFDSIKRGVILTFYTFCSNKKPEAKPRAFYSQNV